MRHRARIALVTPDFNYPAIVAERHAVYDLNSRGGIRMYVMRISCAVAGHRLVYVGHDGYECGCARVAKLGLVSYRRGVISANILGRGRASFR